MRVKPSSIRLALLPASLLALCLWLTSCGGGDKTPAPTPKVLSISPKAGVPGMQVIITGTNFSPSGSVIKFNGLSTSPTSATETQLVVKIPEDAITGFVTVTTDAGTTSGTDFRVYQVYVAGRERLTGGKAIVKIWKNGNPDPISDGSEHATASGFVMMGTDTYVSGFLELSSGNTTPLYWKNKTVVNLPTSQGGVTTDIEVSGADVYVSGYIWEASYGDARATIWKNGAIMTLEKPTNTKSRVFAIAVNGNDVYAVGDIADANDHTTATYWKNGIATSYGALDEFRFSDIQVAGLDIYIAGWQGIGSDARARYWKNGTINNIGTGPESSTASAISIQNVDIYMGGDEAQSGINVPKFWKNGVSQPITSGTTSSYFWKMTVVDGDVISAGIINPDIGFYAVNNNVFPFTTSISPPRIGGVIVK